MKPRTLDNYGAPKIDAFPVSDPENQVAANEYNRALLDLAQLTRPPCRAIVVFNTTAAAPLTYNAADVQHRSIWGSGSAQKPTVAKTATGRYTVTYAASVVDELGDANETENVSFFVATAQSMSATAADNVSARPLTVAGNVVTLVTKKTTTIDDVGDSSAAVFTVILFLY